MFEIKCGIAIIFGGVLDEKEKEDLSEFFSGDKDVAEFSFDTADITLTNKETGEEQQMFPTVALITLSTGFFHPFKWRFEKHSGGRLTPSPESGYIFFYVV